MKKASRNSRLDQSFCEAKLGFSGACQRHRAGICHEDCGRAWYSITALPQQLCSTRKKLTGIARQQALLTPMLFHARLQSFRGVFYQRPLLRLYFKDLGSGRGSGSQPRARVEA